MANALLSEAERLLYSSGEKKTRPPQKADEGEGSGVGGPNPNGSSNGEKGAGNNNGKNNGDEDKLSSLLLKAFLWMLTAYFFIAVGSISIK